MKNVIILTIFISCFFSFQQTQTLKAETGYKMWLRYQPIQNEILKAKYSEYCKNITVVDESEILSTPKTELETGIK